MNRTLHYFNTIGVVALAILCVLQWRANRNYNLEANRLEKTRIEQAAQIEELTKTLSGYTEDLENFRGQLTSATTTRKDTETKLAATEREAEQLKADNAQLKSSVSTWAEAVKLRDERIKEASERIQNLSEQLNASIVSYNKLATNYNTAVSQLNAFRTPSKPETSATQK